MSFHDHVNDDGWQKEEDRGDDQVVPGRRNLWKTEETTRLCLVVRGNYLKDDRGENRVVMLDDSGSFLDLVSCNEKVAKPIRPWWFLDVLSRSLMTKWPLAGVRSLHFNV
ncbi:hypothetical protein CEXT_39061 [Caerostris extrusa]|uniref:Uncharacterized protein n=1 Tax=Caerostris extrusa TaxID=172846 RepID=A0AAV4THY5_CAEEX|nr:hypothetical protein CEXT_39061 [Caerostris extrusa]